jgi:hypothetical protein
LNSGDESRHCSIGEILNPKHEILNNTEIQKSKVKNKDDNSKCKEFRKRLLYYLPFISKVRVKFPLPLKLPPLGGRENYNEFFVMN